MLLSYCVAAPARSGIAKTVSREEERAKAPGGAIGVGAIRGYAVGRGEVHVTAILLDRDVERASCSCGSSPPPARLERKDSGGWVALFHPSIREDPVCVQFAPQRACVRDWGRSSRRKGRREHDVDFVTGSHHPKLCCTESVEKRRSVCVADTRRTTAEELFGTDCCVPGRKEAEVPLYRLVYPVVACAVAAPLVLFMIFCPVMCALVSLRLYPALDGKRHPYFLWGLWSVFSKKRAMKSTRGHVTNVCVAVRCSMDVALQVFSCLPLRAPAGVSCTPYKRDTLPWQS